MIGIKKMNLNQLAQHYAVLSALKEHHNAKLKAINKLIDESSSALFERFVDEEIAEVKIAPYKTVEGQKLLIFPDGCSRKVAPEEKPKGSITKANKKSAFAWFRDHGHGSMIEENIHHATLNAWIKEQTANNLPLPPKNLVGVFIVKGAKITKVR